VNGSKLAILGLAVSGHQAACKIICKLIPEYIPDPLRGGFWFGVLGDLVRDSLTGLLMFSFLCHDTVF
jgi:hypothetical protein